MPLSHGNIAADSSDPTAPHQAQTSPQSRNPFVASPSVEATVSQPTATPEAQRKYSIDAAGRRKSATDGTFAAALMHQKRALGDPLQAAKRESFNDQRRDSGWLGGLWNNWTRGGGMGSDSGWTSKNMTGIKGGATANSVHYGKH